MTRTQPDMDEAEGPAAIDADDVTPGECGQMLSLTPPEVDATVPTAMATAQDSISGSVYANAVFRLPDDVPAEAWSPDAYAAVMDVCSSFDIKADGETIHLTLTDLDVEDLGEQEVAFEIAGSSGYAEISMALGLVQADDDLMVMLIGVSTTGDLDRTEFTGLLTTATDRASWTPQARLTPERAPRTRSPTGPTPRCRRSRARRRSR